MNPAKWQQLEEIFDRALEIRKEDRTAYCDQACGSDTEMRMELKKLLDGHALAEEKQFLHQAAWRINVEIINEDAMIGRIVGKNYRIKKKINEGGFGEVYQAVGLIDGREAGSYVVKVAKHYEGDDKRQFLEEVRILAELKHENIAPIDYWDEVDGRPFYVMKYLPGVNLGEYIQLHKTGQKGLELPVVAEITRQACAGLQAAHDHDPRVIHRDIKPENIMIEQSGDKLSVKLIDFGLAKTADRLTRRATAPGLIIGTFNYISPEQIDPDSFGTPDLRCDIYSMGLVIYQMLTGRIAFTGDTKALMNKQLNQIPPPPGINSLVDQVVMKAVKKNPAERQGSARELSNELSAAIKGDPAATQPIPLPHPNGNSHRWAMLISASSLIILMVAIFLVVQNWPKGAEQIITSSTTPKVEAAKSILSVPIPIPIMTIYQQTTAGGQGEAVKDKIFTSKDGLRFAVTPPADGYIYLVQRGSLGDLTLIYPDSQKGIKDNLVKGGMPVFFPPADATGKPDWFNFSNDPGLETVYGVFVKDKTDKIASAIEEGIRRNRRSPSRINQFHIEEGNQLLLDEGIEVLLQNEIEKPSSNSVSVSKLVFNHK